MAVYLIVQKRHLKTVCTVKPFSLLWHFCNHCHSFYVDTVIFSGYFVVKELPRKDREKKNFYLLLS